MDVIAFDKFVSAERFRELGVEGAESLEDLFGRADVVTVHVPKTPETINLIDAEAIGQMKQGVRIVNCARGELVDLDALAGRPGVGQGRRRRARRLPLRALHRAPDLRPRRRRRHPAPWRLDRRGPGPRRRRHRRTGDRGADRRRRHQRGQHRRGAAGGDGSALALRAALRKARPPGRGPRPRARSTASRSSSAASSPQHDTRLLGIAVLVGILSGHTEEPVNLVNAPQMAEERGVDLVETKESSSEDFTELVTVRLGSGERRSRGRRHRRRAAQRALPGLGLGRELLPALRRAHRRLPLRRPSRHDRPGRHDVRRGGRQHRLRRGRRRGGRRARGDGADHRRRGQRGRRSPRSSSSTASPSAARSIFRPRPVK